jgi:hypothetical protein
VGISPNDGRIVRKIAVRLSIRLNTSMEYFMNMPVRELIEIVEEVSELGQ